MAVVLTARAARLQASDVADNVTGDGRTDENDEHHRSQPHGVNHMTTERQHSTKILP